MGGNLRKISEKEVEVVEPEALRKEVASCIAMVYDRYRHDSPA
ncbi:MAG: hypothetical protein WC091_04440 [Sulfuricellaceae bacterium]